VTRSVTGIQDVGSLASDGLKLANNRIDGGSGPCEVPGAVKWPAVTMTRSAIRVPLANPRSSTSRPASSTRQTMTTPTEGYRFSRSLDAWGKMAPDPGPRAAMPVIAIVMNFKRR